MEIDTSESGEVYCPYCGQKCSDNFLIDMSDNEEYFDCESKTCGETFIVAAEVVAKYSTRKMNE